MDVAALLGHLRFKQLRREQEHALLRSHQVHEGAQSFMSGRPYLGRHDELVARFGGRDRRQHADDRRASHVPVSSTSEGETAVKP